MGGNYSREEPIKVNTIVSVVFFIVLEIYNFR